MMYMGAIITVVSCETYPTPLHSPTYNKSSTLPSRSMDTSYEDLAKNYKSETPEVLTYLLNEEDPNSPKTAITVENTSPCPMVLTIIGNNYQKKIPIAAGKIGSAMILKNKNYQLSGKICNSNYKSNKYITGVTTIKVSQ